MPRKYKRQRRRKFNKQAAAHVPWYNRKYSPSEIATKAYNGVQYLRGLVNSEMYKYDTAFTGTAISLDASTVSHLTAIANGDVDGSRTGSSILVKSIDCKGILTYNSSSTVQAQTVEVFLIIDTQQIGDTPPVFTDIFDAAVPWAHLNVNTVGRFRILMRKRVILEKNGDGAKSINFNCPLQHHVRYNGTASSDIQKGGIYLVLISDVAAASNPPAFSARVRTSYHDN